MANRKLYAHGRYQNMTTKYFFASDRGIQRFCLAVLYHDVELLSNLSAHNIKTLETTKYLNKSRNWKMSKIKSAVLTISNFWHVNQNDWEGLSETEQSRYITEQSKFTSQGCYRCFTHFSPNVSFLYPL